MATVPPKIIYETEDEKFRPSKKHESDVGYDIWLTKQYPSKWVDKLEIQVYGTGLKIQPPSGYYTEIVPRSSLSKTGFIMANQVGIIDPDYRGEIIIKLINLDHINPKKLNLPCKAVQMIIRHIHTADFHIGKVNDTVRGTGGFGSTDS